jgi:Ras-related protein Rab-35
MEIKLFETSAKENINVEEMFRAITDLVLKSKKDQQERLNNQVSGPLNLFVFVSATK